MPPPRARPVSAGGGADPDGSAERPAAAPQEAGIGSAGAPDSVRGPEGGSRVTSDSPWSVSCDS